MYVDANERDNNDDDNYNVNDDARDIGGRDDADEDCGDVGNENDSNNECHVKDDDKMPKLIVMMNFTLMMPLIMTMNIILLLIVMITILPTVMTPTMNMMKIKLLMGGVNGKKQLLAGRSKVEDEAKR